MKKILLSYVFILSFLSQAQTLCSEGVGHYTVGTQAEPEVVFGTTGNGLPIMAPQYVYTTIGQNSSSDSCFGQPCSHKISNTTNEDTLTTHLTYSLTDSVGNVSDLNCSLTQYWNGTNWQWLSESSLGREELKRANVRAYPNPSNGRFTIQGDKEEDIFYQVLDNLGRLIDIGIIHDGSKEFDLSDQPKGVYSIHVVNGNGTRTLNVVIQ